MTFDQLMAALLALIWVALHLQYIEILTHRSVRAFWLRSGREFLISKLLFVGAIAACGLMTLFPHRAEWSAFVSLCLMLGHSLTAVRR